MVAAASDSQGVDDSVCQGDHAHGDHAFVASLADVAHREVVVDDGFDEVIVESPLVEDGVHDGGVVYQEPSAFDEFDGEVVFACSLDGVDVI